MDMAQKQKLHFESVSRKSESDPLKSGSERDYLLGPFWRYFSYHFS